LRFHYPQGITIRVDFSKVPFALIAVQVAQKAGPLRQNGYSCFRWVANLSALSVPTWLVTVERRSAVNQQCIQMMWPLFGVNYDHIRTSRRNGDEIRMRHLVGFATRHMNFVGTKGTA
jgi:hypothetical protein